ncbi:MAG: APC family permease [Acidobacteria bacterium]|nr:APC family permease [Acidobacteriota bacterium]
MSSAAPTAASGEPHLRRVLGQRDLILLFVVAVVNLNIVPVVAGGGPVVLWLWLLALVLFFWPQGVAVIEFSRRYPGEGGVYLWAKEQFGDWHGFMSGWCYWTNNVFYVPTVLLYLVGISVYVAGPEAAELANDRIFALCFSLGLLWLLVALNIRGLSVGKWVNNLGGIGTAIAGASLIGLGLLVWRTQGSGFHIADFAVASADWRLISSFGVICFGLVGLELGSVMGDEIRDPQRTVPGAVIWGGVLSAILYVGATLSVLVAVPRSEIGVVQGILQAISKMAAITDLGLLVSPLALVLSVSIAGIASAWLAGSARIPFVAGLDRYLPAALGRLHPRFDTPHVALIVHACLSSIFVAMSFVGATVKEAYVTLLDLAVVLQLVPFLYIYAGLVRLAMKGPCGAGHYSPGNLWLAGVSGLLTTSLGMVVAFVPSRQIESVWLFELKMLLGCAFFLGVAGFFFWVYASRKARGKWAAAKAASGSQGEVL